MIKKSPEMIKNEQALSDLRRAVNVADKIQRGVVALERALGIENFCLELEERKAILVPEIEDLKKTSRKLRDSIKTSQQKLEDATKELQVFKATELSRIDRILETKNREVSLALEKLSKDLLDAQARHRISIGDMKTEKEDLESEIFSIRGTLDKLLSSVKNIN